MNLLVRDLLSQVQTFLQGGLTVDALNAWLVAHTWDNDFQKDPVLRRFVGRVELLLAEHSCGHLDVDELKAELVELISHREAPLDVMALD